MAIHNGQHFIDFDAPAAPPSATSRAAAKRQTPAKKQTDQDRILEVLTRLGPLTDEGIDQATGLGLNTVRPRRGELVKAGRVRAVDGQGVTQAGNRATRWGVSR